MTRPIGYYVHHHGAGHRARALAIADRAGGRVTLLGTGLAGRTGSHPCIDLPDDRIDAAFRGDDGVADRPTALHYAPLDHDGIRGRVAAIARWIAEARPALVVVDVSCEVAMLARLASVPTVYVRLAGCREDAPHLEAFRSAQALIAPFAAVLDDPAVPEWVRTKTIYCPGLVTRADRQDVDAKSVTVVIGDGGSSTGAADWARAARACPDRTWTVLGRCDPVVDPPANLTIFGWVDDVGDRIARSDVVVGNAGNGIVGAVIAAGRPFVCIPEDRPFDEQRSQAARLAAAGAAVVCDDAAMADWPALVAAAAALDPAVMAVLDDVDGPARAAARLISIADGAGA